MDKIKKILYILVYIIINNSNAASTPLEVKSLESEIIFNFNHEKEKTVNKAIPLLEKLRFDWKSNQLDYQILTQLALYYQAINKNIDSLRIYKYMHNMFNSELDKSYINSHIEKLLNEIFLPSSAAEKIDDFTIIALFYEFKELIPLNEQGDDIIINITKKLVNLDLLEQAIELLRYQVKYRLQNEKNVINADNLAIILLMDKKPNEAISILNETDKYNFSFHQHQYRIRLRAWALIDLKKYNKAIEYLKNDDTQEAEIIRREALFRGENWYGYIDRINNNLDLIIEKLDANNTAETQDILRLAISYYMLNKKEELNKLLLSIGEKNIILKNLIELLDVNSATIDYKNLDKGLNIDQIRVLLEKCKNQFLGA